MRFRDWRRMSEQAKTLMPKLRFPRFINDKAWDSKKLVDLIDTVTPPQKLQTSQYQIAGKYPIFDQSQSYICGWTDNKESLVTDNLPLIIFGDHTCALKIADKPFAQGADGIKILKTNNEVETQFLYQSLQNKPLIMEEYKRHFSTLKERVVFYPDINTGEQQKIVDCLSSLDDLITAQHQKVEDLKQHKKGLMQQIFPAEGETVPKLRFSEFENDGEWQVRRFGEICKFVRGPFGGALKKEIFVKDGYAVYEQSHAIYASFDAFRYYISEEKFSELKRFAVAPGDIIMSCSGTMGKFAVVPTDAKKGVINQALLKLSVNKEFNLDFVLYTLELPENQDKLLLQSAGGAIKNVVGVAEIKEIELNLPNGKEQQKIADFLSSIDDLITSQTQQLEAYKTHKKGLMQQLFPMLDEA